MDVVALNHSDDCPATPSFDQPAESTGQPECWSCLSKEHSEVLRLDLKVLRLAMVCGDVDIASWLLERNPDFLAMIQRVDGEAARLAMEGKSWLATAQEFEAVNGPGSRLDRSNPVVIRRESALKQRKQVEPPEDQ